MGNAALGGRSKAKRSQVTLLTSAPDSSSQHFINAAAACDQPAPVPPSSAKNDKSLKKGDRAGVVASWLAARTQMIVSECEVRGRGLW